MFRSSDPFLPDYPCIIDINSSHNHRIKSAVTLSYRDPDQAVRDKFLELFKAGHSATQAVAAHKRDLMDEYEDDYYLACADRAVCPDVKWVQNLLSTSFASEFGPSAGDAMAKHLEKIVSDYNTGGNKAVMIHCQNDIIVAVSSTLMQRTTSSVTSALHNFGKTPGMTAFAFRRRNRAAIPVQPTAVARRKVRFGGRRCAISGRPPKSSFAGAHNYAKPSQGVASAFELPRKRARKPHTLSDCVTANMSSAK